MSYDFTVLAPDLIGTHEAARALHDAISSDSETTDIPDAMARFIDELHAKYGYDNGRRDEVFQRVAHRQHGRVTIAQLHRIFCSAVAGAAPSLNADALWMDARLRSAAVKSLVCQRWFVPARVSGRRQARRRPFGAARDNPAQGKLMTSAVMRTTRSARKVTAAMIGGARRVRAPIQEPRLIGRISGPHRLWRARPTDPSILAVTVSVTELEVCR